MEDKCDTCFYCRTIKEVCRGSMDCDPPEVYCKLDREEFYDEEAECPKWEQDLTYDEWYERYEL